MARHRYQQLVSALRDADNHNGGCGPQPARVRASFNVAIACFFIYTTGFGFFSMFIAQAIANEIHHDLLLLSIVPALIVMFLLVLQTGTAIVPFELILKAPLLERYEMEGTNLMARRMWRRRTEDPKTRVVTFEVVVVYDSDVNQRSTYGKKMVVKEYEYDSEEIDVTFIPENPTSVVLTRKITNRSGCRQEAIAILVLLAIFGNGMLVMATYKLLPYNYNAFWASGGPWAMIAIGWIGSVCNAYSWLQANVR